jgi:hypothetical protein
MYEPLPAEKLPLPACSFGELELKDRIKIAASRDGKASATEAEEESRKDECEITEQIMEPPCRKPL